MIEDADVQDFAGIDQLQIHVNTSPDGLTWTGPQGAWTVTVPAGVSITVAVGVITIEAASLGRPHLDAVGADPATPVEGISPGSALHRTLLEDLPTLDRADAQAQVLAAAQRLRAREPGLDTLVLECTNLLPYADALRRATGLQVLDVVTLLNDRMAALAAPAAR